MGAYGSGEHDGLEVATARGEALDVVAVGDVDGVLLDDRPLVEIGGGVVRRGADELDATLEGLAVRVRPDECGQERMMDVDDPVRDASRRIDR